MQAHLSAGTPSLFAPLIPAELHLMPDGTPLSAPYGDVYHSRSGGIGQAEHVFLGGNGLPEAWLGRDRFTILETGFGLGLNFLVTMRAWCQHRPAGQQLHYLAVEKHPFLSVDLLELHRNWPELRPWSDALGAQWPDPLPGYHRLHFPDWGVTLTLMLGDALPLLRECDALPHGPVDAFYLDGFTPEKNPDLWSPAVCRELARLGAPAARCATYTVAATVRHALTEAGFSVQRVPGYGGKRHMLTGQLTRAVPPQATPPAVDSAHETGSRSALVVGAGLAGCAVAERLSARGWHVTVLEQGPDVASEASGNHTGAFLPRPSRDDNLASQFTRTALDYSARWRAQLQLPPDAQQACGVLQFARDAQEARYMADIAAQGYPSSHLQWLDVGTLDQRGLDSGPLGAWYFPQGGWARPAILCRTALQQHPGRIHLHTGAAVARIQATPSGWQALDAQGAILSSASHLVLATGAHQALLPEHLPLQAVAGQLSYLAAEHTRAPNMVLCGDGYLIPAVDGICTLGASYECDRGHPDDTPDTALRASSHAENLQRLEGLLPGATAEASTHGLRGRVAFRGISRDRLPLVGAMPVPPAPTARPTPQTDAMPRQQGLWICAGLGSRGLVWAPLAAELLASQMSGDPGPVPKRIRAALDPARFLARAQRRPAASGLAS